MFHAVADQDFRSEKNLGRDRGKSQTERFPAVLPTRQKGGYGFLAGIKMRRGTDCLYSRIRCHGKLTQRGIKSVAAMIAAGKNMRMIVKREIEFVHIKPAVSGRENEA